MQNPTASSYSRGHAEFSVARRRDRRGARRWPLPAVVQAQQAGASTGIEEIVVTAQRREENLQDVGIAVTALGCQQLGQPQHHGRRPTSRARCPA